MPTICTVSGTLLSPEGVGIQNAIIKVTVISPFFHSDGSLIPAHVVQATTDADGLWDIDLIETETIEKDYRLDIEYPNADGGAFRATYTIVVPDAATANFADIVVTA